jgi:hypothetical protein
MTMSQIKIRDLEFCQTESLRLGNIQGQGWVLNDISFQPLFVFDFSHNRIGSFSQGFIAAFGIAIGPAITISSGG